MLNYQTEIERIHHNQLILSLLKRKQENRELSPVKSKAKYSNNSSAEIRNLIVLQKNAQFL